MGNSEINSKKIDSKYQGLFNLMHQEHGLKLLESEMQEIINEVEKFFQLEYTEYLEEDEKNHKNILKLIREHDTHTDSVLNSHSPTEPEFNTLQEGDWFIGTDEEYRHVLSLHDCLIIDERFCKEGLFFSGSILLVRTSGSHKFEGKTQLTPEEFLRRAENTFKKK